MKDKEKWREGENRGGGRSKERWNKGGREERKEEGKDNLNVHMSSVEIHGGTLSKRLTLF